MCFCLKKETLIYIVFFFRNNPFMSFEEELKTQVIQQMEFELWPQSHNPLVNWLKGHVKVTLTIINPLDRWVSLMVCIFYWAVSFYLSLSSSVFYVCEFRIKTKAVIIFIHFYFYLIKYLQCLHLILFIVHVLDRICEVRKEIFSHYKIYCFVWFLRYIYTHKFVKSLLK